LSHFLALAEFGRSASNLFIFLLDKNKMISKIHAVTLTALFLPLTAIAVDYTNQPSTRFDEWVYPGSLLIHEGRPTTAPPTQGTGQYSTKDSVQKVLRFYAEKAGFDPNAKPLDLEKPGDASVIAVRTHDDAPSAMMLRNAGESTLAATILNWTPGDSQKIAVSITRGTQTQELTFNSSFIDANDAE
jgi:hypothetical protein